MQMKKRNKRIPALLLLTAIVLGGFLVRLVKIDSPVADWHSWRQADTASVTKNFVERGVDLLYPRYHDVSSIQSGMTNLRGFRMVEFPVFNLFHYMFFSLFGTFSLEVWGRLTSVFSALVTSLFLYKLGQKFIGIAGGLLTAFFYLFIPFNIYFTRVILPEPLSVAFGVAAVWFFVKYFYSDSAFSLFFSAILFAISLLIKPFAVFYSIPVIYLIFVKHKSIYGIAKSIRLLIYLDIALIPLFLWRAWINQFPQGIPRFVWAFNGDNIRFRPAFWRWIFAERLGTLILGVSGIALFVEGLLHSKTFLKMFFLGSLVYVTVFATANVRHDYYQTFIIAPVSLVLAQGFISYWRQKNDLLPKFTAVFVVAVMFLVGFDRVKEFYKINHPEIIEAGRAVARVAPKQSLVIAPYNGDTAFLYQTGRWGWPVIDSSIPEIVEKGAQFYVSVNFDKDTTYAMENYKVIEKTDKYVVVDLRN
ncbi:hypothetical protein A3D84_00670 [Candidatus Woesebacteria bacterium RIFCSPHIGHO2_02_FULL_42_20]|uniref:Glycosyltransferase RgtA/B/C/D-like domain-containing protein n=1 Tax=Candidatus Woesebacteria bacterium RIFCSPHIGHO2_12_FULL_41_24 TaxID=1802510 RepID=A0A1F8AQB4_9BACT|nr:MAG: hypothetical protein A3D84_00670 [Candidatus Woesebacteria bacterium RIFCSPHIGHO2_02_FULL_42_20]OGM53831.1 MAG: hypothetical protein A3E44_05440 [Candidatus Woesebacteria bacterium RIFCSPHIGHO2_12_FULL_41_24]